MEWMDIANCVGPTSNIVLFKRIDGVYELAYRKFDKFYTKDGKNILDYGIMLEYWMDIKVPDQPERLSEKDVLEMYEKYKENT